MPRSSRRDVLASLVSTLAVATLAPALSTGCATRRRTRDALEVSDDQMMVTVDAVRGATAPFALRGRFSVRLESPGTSGTVQGAVILHQPNRFRIELLTPFGTPLLTVASNGTSLHAWSQREGRFYRGNDAARVLDELTGGAVGLADVNAVLMGLLPLSDAPIVDLGEDSDGGVRLTLEAPEQMRVLAVLDPKEEITRELRVMRMSDSQRVQVPGIDPAQLPLGETLVEVRYLETMRVGRDRLPEEVTISLPPLAWTLELDFQSWDELGQIPEVFDLSTPPGAQEADLVQTLQALAEQAEAGG